MENLEESRPDVTKNWRSEKKAVRETRIRSIHDVEEFKRAQELRIDEFSRHELRESRATFQELTSQTQELQDRVNFMNDSREFQDVESICSGKSSHIPSQPAIVPSPCGTLSRNQSLRPDTWNLLGTSGNVFGSPLRQSIHHRHPTEVCFILGIKVPQMGSRCETVQGDCSEK